MNVPLHAHCTTHFRPDLRQHSATWQTPVISLPEEMLEYYIKHRKIRHERVLDAVETSPKLEEIARIAYENSPEAHPGLAIDQTLSHLLSHEKDGNVRRSEDGWVRA